jgi:hypothetical protein
MLDFDQTYSLDTPSSAHTEPISEPTPLSTSVLAVPRVFRVVRIRVVQGASGFTIRAKLFHRRSSPIVVWTRRQWNDDIALGDLVSIRACSRAFDDDQADVPIIRLVRMRFVEPDVDLFETVPASWLSDVSLLQMASHLWSRLSRPWRAWFNALFWNEAERFKGYLQAPASMAHHHCRMHGLFEHSLDCAQRARLLAQGDETVHLDLLTMAALTHDVGKAQEYEWSSFKQSWFLSNRGVLLGHKLSGMEWLVQARAILRECDQLQEAAAMALYHAIMACHAPDWVGLRGPRSPEAFYLSSVDSLSGHCELVQRLANPAGGFGKFHFSIRGGPYTLAQSQLLR